MSADARMEMEANLSSISRKIGKANFLLRNMRSRWDIFRERHKHLVPLVHERYLATPSFTVAALKTLGDENINIL